MATQLDLIFGMEDKTIPRQLKKIIMKTLNDTFDLGLSFDSQPRSTLDSFDRAMLEQFPQLLNNPLWTNSERKRRMAAVYQYARRRFSHQRTLTREARADGLVTGRTVNEYRQRLGRGNWGQSYDRSKLSLPQDAPLTSSSTTDTTALPTPPTGRIKTSSEPNTIPEIPPSPEPRSPSIPASPTTLVESTPHIPLGPLPESLQTRAEEVANFLRMCIPDMSYFLPAFIEFGCRSRDFLVALAGYSDERVDDVLRKIARNISSEVVVTEMDIWVLKEGLKKVSLTTKSKSTSSSMARF